MTDGIGLPEKALKLGKRDVCVDKAFDAERNSCRRKEKCDPASIRAHGDSTLESRPSGKPNSELTTVSREN